MSAVVKSKFNAVRKTSYERQKQVENYLKLFQRLLKRGGAHSRWLSGTIFYRQKEQSIANYMSHVYRQIDQVKRRLLNGDTIPTDAKVMSIFNPYMR